MNRRSPGLLLALCLGCAGCAALAGCHGKQGSGPSAQSGEGASDSKGESRGASLPPDAVKIPAADQARAGIGVSAVTVRAMPRTVMLPAQVTLDEKHTEHIGALADGRIESVRVVAGDPVRRGETLATLHSHEVHETVAALIQAFAAERRQQSAVAFATTARDRYTRLYSIQAASLEEKQRAEQELAQANKDLVDADASVKAEREHLGELLQVSPASLTPGNLYNRELIPVRAVADGVVITRAVTVGQVVSMGDEAFVTSNLSTVWVKAAISEQDLPLVRPGASASITLRGAEASAMHGTVSLLEDVVDPQTRTVPVRIVVPNPGTRLRPGMFVSAAITGQQTRTAIFVPADALQDINGFRVVFVTGDGVTFLTRAVKTGAESQGMVEITEGLTPQDRVVTRGAFMVKGELLKGTVGEG